MRAFPVVACVLVLPRLALAQSSSSAFPIAISGAGIVVNGVTRIGSQNCGQAITVSWGPLQPAGTVCVAPQFWITTSVCGDDPQAGDKQIGSASSTLDRQGTLSPPVNVNDLPIFGQADGGGLCGSVTTNVTMLVCGSLKYNTSSFGCGTNNVTQRATNATIQYRGARPAAPILDSVVSQDSALTVNVVSSSISDANLVHVQYRPTGQGNFAEVTFSPDRSSVKITGLVNGTEYEVQAFNDDGVGNNSDLSQTLTGIPVASEGFFGQYRRLGGEETGGCGGALPGVIGVPVALGLRLLRRKRSCRRDS